MSPHANDWVGFVEYRFEMPQKVPSYLIALAVGDLQMRKIGPRSVVWAEPCLVDAAQKEFDGITEEYLEAGIALFGPYEWEDYNILVVPCFPYGGMENPRLTFVSPTLVVGDRSLTGVVAHEIAHSWTGNLVTNSNWGEFWLNEGFTMYAEREIVASVQGRALSDLQAYQGMNLLKEEYKNIGEENPITALRAKIDGIDPDDAYCQCAYEGGYLLLKHIEGLVGGRDVFVPFLRAYVAKYRWQSVTTADFIAFLAESFPGKINVEEISRYVDQTGSAHVHWLGKGSELRDLALSHANAWWCDGTCGLKSLTCVDTMTVMLDEIFDKIEPLVFPQHSAIEQAKAEDPARSEKLLVHAHKLVHSLDTSYSLSATPNPEISMRFTKLVVITKSTDLYPAAETYLLKKAKGKQKFLLPVFRLIGRIADDVQMAWARQVFAKLDGRINQGVTKYIRRILA
jgi:aminopeptidase B